MSLRYVLKLLTVAVIFFISFIQIEDVIGQSFGDSPSDSTEMVTDADAPNVEPYRSERSAMSHLLALPSYLFHWSTRPVGWGVKWAETKLPRLLQGERGDFGVFPLFELGGETGFSYGALIFHRSLFHDNHNLRFEGLFGSSSYNEFHFEYTISNFLSENGSLVLETEYGNKPNRTFLLGNNIDFDERSFFEREEFLASVEYSHKITDDKFIRFKPRFLNKKISQSEPEDEDVEEDGYNIFPENLTGTTSLLSMGTSFEWDGAKGLPRVTHGTRFFTGFTWNRSLNRNDFHYAEYNIEVNQFIPIYFLHETRRFALKANMIKTESFRGKETPFYDLPSLGSSNDLRGFSTDRFRDTGSLLFTLEYRYPIWNFSDMVFFIDEGQVFNHYSEIGINRFNTSYGFGFHLISSKGFALRSEFAFSRETSRFILLISPNF
ncbi:MAG: BamA/TamA family outer membrane protein [Balneolaceae bacterium]|nr:BamA/TamA family outer membrane protein [Balneolaceae bacterium]